MDPITVGTADFRTALQAVAPHAAGNKDQLCHRIRLEIGRVNLTVSATNRRTVAHALVSVEDGYAVDEPTTLDLSPLAAREICTLFKPPRKFGGGDDEEVGAIISLAVKDLELIVTDVSGLFPGKALVLPHYGIQDGYVNVPAMLAGMLARKRTDITRLAAHGPHLALFGAAARAYDRELILEPTGDTTGLIVSCGESFLGALMPTRLAEDETTHVKAWRTAWELRLGKGDPAAADALTDLEPVDDDPEDDPSNDDG